MLRRFFVSSDLVGLMLLIPIAVVFLTPSSSGRTNLNEMAFSFILILWSHERKKEKFADIIAHHHA